MLLGLVIRDIVLIDRLDLSLHPGLNVFTGETGAGKSILLDALGLALGGRAEIALIRHDAERASVSAEFDLAAGHPVRRLMAEHGIEPEDTVVLRRVIERQGRSRAFLDDQPISVNLLRRVGEALVEVHGTADERGLLNSGSHRVLIDAFGGLDETAASVARGWEEMRAAAEAAASAEERLASDAADREYLRHVLAELDELAPEPGEEQHLAEERALLMQGERFGEALTAAQAAVDDDGGALDRLHAAQSALAKVAGAAGGRLDGPLAALDRAGAELADALAVVEGAARDLRFDPERLARAEERLFALRALARKHRTPVDALPDLREGMAEKLKSLEEGAADVARLQEAADAARAAYAERAQALSEARRQAASKLDAAVADELFPLKLDKARFCTAVDRLDEDEWSRHGADRIAFQVATNPGTPLGPLARVASGGELSRFMLALKVVLAGARSAPTLIFDEVDRGVGGATADAVGERLSRLSAHDQVLVVTHSPQVAARAGHHLRVEKRQNGKAVTRVEELDEAGRREEIARMLAGAEVTKEARAAAESLIQGQRA